MHYLFQNKNNLLFPIVSVNKAWEKEGDRQSDTGEVYQSSRGGSTYKVRSMEVQICPLPLSIETIFAVKKNDVNTDIV